MAAQQPDDGAALDHTRLQELEALFPGEELGTMLRQLASTIEGDLQRIQAAIADDDPQTVAQAAHGIRGSAHLIGASEVSVAATAVQRHAEAATTDAAAITPASVEHLQEGWHAAKAALEGRIERCGGRRRETFDATKRTARQG